MDRYIRNKITLSDQEMELLGRAKVCVIGCGGLGGYIIEMLGRIGVGSVTAIDGDVFDETNLNRQILSNTDTLGLNKAEIAKERMVLVNPEITVHAKCVFLKEDNGEDLLIGHDVIVDALDDIKTRLVVQGIAERLKIPFVHGAIAGWYGQVATIFPGENLLNKIYKSKASKGKEKLLGNPSFSPALVSAIEVSEVIKILINRGELLRNKLLCINLLEQEYDIINL